MKECKVINFNDGTGVEITNGNWHLIEEYPWVEEKLEALFAEGFSLTHVIPLLTPAIQEKGNFTFYRGGFVAFLERDITDATKKLSLKCDEVDFAGTGAAAYAEDEEEDILSQVLAELEAEEGEIE